MWIYNRSYTMGSGIFTAKIKNIKFVFEMPSGKVLTKFTANEEAYIRLNPSLFTWCEDKREEGKRADQVEIQDKQANLILSIVEEELKVQTTPKKTSTKKGGKA